MSRQLEDFPAPISANLIAEMDRTHMTSAFVARQLQIHERNITRWRAGVEPRYESVVRLAMLFGRSPEWFYTDHDRSAAA